MHARSILFSDLNLPGRLKTVSVKDHACVEHTKKVYYSCSFEPSLKLPDPIFTQGHYRLQYEECDTASDNVPAQK